MQPSLFSHPLMAMTSKKTTLRYPLIYNKITLSGKKIKGKNLNSIEI